MKKLIWSSFVTWTRILKQHWLLALLQVGVGITLGVAMVFTFSAGAIYEYRDSLDGAVLPKVDTIVCLAGGKGRISAAGDLWYRYYEAHQVDSENPLPILYFSGVGPQANWSTLGKQLRPGVLKALKPENVVIENQSTNTEENALWLIRYARERQWKQVVLMTSPYHMRRAKMMFLRIIEAAQALGVGDRMGYLTSIETLSVIQDPYEPGEWYSTFQGVRVTVFEYFKLLYYQTFWQPEVSTLKLVPEYR